MSEDNKVDPVDVYVGKRLKSRRLMLGLSQNDLGDSVGVSIQQIQKYERATNRISSSKLYNLAKFLRVPVSYFFANDLEPLNVPGFAEEQTAFEDKGPNNVPEKEIMTLARYYAGINDPQVRKKVLDLVKTFTNTIPND